MSPTHCSFILRIPTLTPPNTSQRSYRAKFTCKLNRLRTTMKEITGISEIVNRYDCILLDQFGVIHDGKTPYPNAIKTVNKLSEKGIKIIILSNSSKQPHHAAEKLRRMGFDTDKIYGIVTSGGIALEIVRKYMNDNEHSRVLHFNWGKERGTISLSAHQIKQVATMTTIGDRDLNVNLSTVDFILGHGTDGVTTNDSSVCTTSLSHLRELATTLGREKPHIPFFCANPDMVTVDGGKLRVMPGTLAEDFEKAGGKNVVRLGKPDKIAYETAKSMTQSPGQTRFLAIGDSLAHDILGAANANIDSLYIAGGINAKDFGIDPADGFRDNPTALNWNTSMLTDLIQKEAADLADRRPMYISSFFRW